MMFKVNKLNFLKSSSLMPLITLYSYPSVSILRISILFIDFFLMIFDKFSKAIFCFFFKNLLPLKKNENNFFFFYNKMMSDQFH